ncbi:MAG: hypothetical protein AAF518_21525 [Spirochaetota bacterium]
MTFSENTQDSSTIDYEQIMVYFSDLEEGEQKRILRLLRFLQVKYSNSGEQFKTYCGANGKFTLSNENRTELKNRIQEITQNPEISVSGADVLKEIEVMLGRKIQISP